MDRIEQARLAERFRERHHDGPMVVLPNAFDVATALLIARRHPDAIGTTSAATAAILGYPDGELIGREEMLDAIRRIVAAVEIGVTADIEAGYGDTPEEAATLARELIEIGAIGLNLEDTGHPTGQWKGRLLPLDRACGKIAAIREVAEQEGVSLVLNARTDTFLAQGDQVEHAIERGNAYLAAGADCVFVPGVGDIDGIARLVAGLRGPLNIYAGPGVAPVADLAALGVRRLSVGCGPYQACLALVARAVDELLENGTYAAFTSEQLSGRDLRELLASSLDAAAPPTP